jgi:uncharacterized membrane protein
MYRAVEHPRSLALSMEPATRRKIVMQPLEKRTCRADREAAADILAQHYAIGSIDDEELSERLDVAMKAKFPSELGGLLADLPCLPGSAPLPQPGSLGYATQDRYVIADGRRVDLRYANQRAMAGKEWRRDPQAGRGMKAWYGTNISHLPMPVRIFLGLVLVIMAFGLWPLTIAAVLIILTVKTVRFWKKQHENSQTPERWRSLAAMPLAVAGIQPETETQRERNNSERIAELRRRLMRGNDHAQGRRVLHFHLADGHLLIRYDGTVEFGSTRPAQESRRQARPAARKRTSSRQDDCMARSATLPTSRK